VNTNRREGDENKASELIEKADISRNILPTQLGEIESYYHGFADPEFFAMRVAYLRLLFRRNKGPNVNPFPPQSASTLLNVQGLRTDATWRGSSISSLTSSRVLASITSWAESFPIDFKNEALHATLFSGESTEREKSMM
jgi:hypothetical protein